MTPINFVIGDATRPQGEGKKVIMHVCNDHGGWGAGFVMALSARSTAPEEDYRRWFKWRGTQIEPPFRLGEIQLVPFSNDTLVANMIAQHGFEPEQVGQHVFPPLRYVPLTTCMIKLRKFILEGPYRNISVHAPRIGCGLAGGEWGKVQPLIEMAFSKHDIPVTIYDLT